MRQATLYRYQIPLQAAAVLRRGEVLYRNGWLMSLQQGARQGWGEVAPLPGFSHESPAQVETQLRTLLLAWCRGEVNQAEDDALWPAVAFGFSCALAELNNTLPPLGEYRSATLCRLSPQGASPIPTDTRLAKIKLAHLSPEVEGRQVAQLLANHPELRLRLDANRRWSLSQALQFANAIPRDLRSHIVFFEEPCATPAVTLLFSQQSGIAIAWDESVREASFQLRPQAEVSAVVIKPMLMGSLTRCTTFIQQAQSFGFACVISSSIESSLGLMQLARLARQLTPDVLPGLDTLSLLSAQVIRAWPGSSLPLLSPDDLEVVCQS